jgi:hypothetical protein
MSDPAPTLRGVGRVIELEAWRQRRKAALLPDIPAGGTYPGLELEPPVRRLETAIARLDRLVNSGHRRIGPRVERELLAITREVTSGRLVAAAERVEQLTGRLEHPSSLAR